MRRAANLRRLACLSLAAAALLAPAAAAAETTTSPEAPQSAPTTRLLYSPGKIVPIPASIPHEEGDMVDRRILANLRWIAARYPIFVTDGYSGPLPNGEWSGCRGCHVRNSDHTLGLAVDIVPLEPSAVCDARWTAITRLARWAEPLQNAPAPPFRWVGYDGDAGHGCGHHLHLSWNHAEARQYELAEWIEVFPTAPGEPAGRPRGKRPPANKAPEGPPGGVSQVTSGGLSPRPGD